MLAPALVMVVVFALIAFVFRSWKLSLATLIGFAVVISMEQWETMMQTMALVLVAIVVALVYALDARWVDTAVLMLAGLGQVIAFLWFRAPWPRAVCSLILLTAAVSAARRA